MEMNDILESYMDIDITDKTILEQQFNYSRRIYFDCIKAMEEVNKKISNLKQDCLDITTGLYSDPNIAKRDINTILKSDEEYQTKLAEIGAYERSLNIITEKINFVKSDIRILSNSMYNKF